MEERRKDKRLEINVEILLGRLNGEGTSAVKNVPVEVTDISRSGIAFVCETEFEPGTYYDTQIQIWTKEVIPAVIHIIRKEALADSRVKYGCEFIGMNETDKLKIKIYEMFHEADEEDS